MLWTSWRNRVRFPLPVRSHSGHRRRPLALAGTVERLEGRQLLTTIGVASAHNPAVAAHVQALSHATTSPTVTYNTSSQVPIQPVSVWQGLRGSSKKGVDLITGTSNNQGLLYVGPIQGQGGRAYAVNYPGSILTSVYGPDNLGHDQVRLVGVYRSPADPTVVHGFFYQGKISDPAFANPHNYHPIDYPGAAYNYVHSTDGGFAVGNEDTRLVNGEPAFAYLDKLATGHFTPIVYPGSAGTTAYGIIHDGGDRYTITGGYAPADGSSAEEGFLADYNARTGVFSHWTSIVSPAGQSGSQVATHIEGISQVKNGVYTLSADAIPKGNPSGGQGYFATVHRNRDGSFGSPSFVPLNLPGTSDTTSANSVFANQVVGVTLGAMPQPYQATISG